MYVYATWTLRKAEHWRIDTFELCCWRRLLRVPWTARRSNQSILNRLVLGVHCRNWCWSWNSNILASWCRDWLIWKDPDAWKDWGQEEKGTTEDEIVGWHHWHNGHGFGWTLGVGDGQGSLAAVAHGIAKNQPRLSDWSEDRVMSLDFLFGMGRHYFWAKCY